MNFETSQVTSVYTFESKFARQPSFFEPNTNQSIFMIASAQDGLYVNLDKKMEVDIDAEYDIEDIKAVIYNAED